MTAGLPVSPSAERNKGPILDVLQAVLPAMGTVLELASGTGQHAVYFASACPGLEWQPSEADPERRATLARRVAAAALPNLRAPLALDALALPWPVAAPVEVVLAINLIHIAPWPVTLALMAGAGSLLAARPAGLLVLYGPYREGGVHTAESNASFDARLKAEDPAWGVRDLGEVAAVAARHGFAAPVVTRMPANNLTLVFRRTGAA